MTGMGENDLGIKSRHRNNYVRTCHDNLKDFPGYVTKPSKSAPSQFAKNFQVKSD